MRLLLIGIGAGHPDHITVQGVSALNAFDVLFLVTKEGTDELVALRRDIVNRHRTAGTFRTVELVDPPRPWRDAPDYRAAVAQWRTQRLEAWSSAIREHLADGETGAFLVWGDPSLFESTLAVVAQTGIEHEVIPGVSAMHALTAAHRIPLNRVGRPVLITPARLLAEGFPDGVEDIVVMLDPGTAFTALPPDGIDIYWGAFLGTPDEVLRAGPLADVATEIATLRAAEKARKGWMFDIYLLRRSP